MTKARLNDLTAPADEARSFDAWFFSQPKKIQEKMRNSGVLPYREMVQHRHVFAVKDEHVEWMRTDNQEHVEVDSDRPGEGHVDHRQHHDDVANDAAASDELERRTAAR